MTSLPEGRFAGRDEFRHVVRQAIEGAASAGWRQAILSDADFADWPLGERAVVDALDAWAHHGTSFKLLAHRYDEVMRQHARFVAWRVRWSHQVECWRDASDARPAWTSLSDAETI